MTETGAAGASESPRPRDSATVMLLRSVAEPAGSGFEVYLLRRASSMAFAPGAHAFPGGGVDRRDVELAPGWTGPSPQVWAQRLGVDTATARALVCAAVRETFEESGVLLAGPSTRELVADTRDEAWERDRRALLDRSLSLAELLARRGLVLRSDLLCPWSRWITPRGQPRRFDTRFFAAALPAGQQARDVGGEADRAAWYAPAAALSAWKRGELPMLPPTMISLRQLAEYTAVTEVLAAHRDLTPIEPELDRVDGRERVLLPDGTTHPLR
ncbi:NUDIX hydrolase [Lipingzhangella sp. LS1_29]|uniref:NUDIX hydrolase n=1 Tax=Lipingzhangella rawalii TaxID=2055835 RepID=A0ABU2H3X6_9ACTN|nr:NUDIX hydrolase [Lipingzhangella rawalii]MDS1270007.1 NUDIX hydrolase [Lipingzhangella rawalii]